MRHIRKHMVLLFLLFLAPLLGATALEAATCAVPSVSYPSIRSAVDDTACTTLTVAAGTYDERLIISRSLIINGAECEPYITCDQRLMRERAMEIIEGVRIMQHIVQPATCTIAVEDSMPAAETALRDALHFTDSTWTLIESLTERVLGWCQELAEDARQMGHSTAAGAARDLAEGARAPLESWQTLRDAVRGARIHDQVMGSDHCPVELELELDGSRPRRHR